ncbi:MAG TPA: ribbon-helix-helix protein, CopG family [Anaerolineae bacterium]|nr:ribbon-helix-helix protein, CopG family [Anaerolineae bacterium]
MEQQLTVRVPAEVVAQLDRAARHLRRTRSEVVRLALEQFLAVQLETRPIERVRDLLGQVESGVPDLGQRHREYLIKRLRHAR